MSAVVDMAARKRTPIPNNSAGRLAFDVYRSLAEKIWAAGKQMTNDFALTNFPDSKTVSATFSDKKFYRVIETSCGEQLTVIYDYLTQTTAVQLPQGDMTMREVM